jgi:8-oxo-dGTP pyrophosphatase MutT (NUDIX family)
MSKTFTFDYFGSIITATSLGTDSVPALRETLTSHCVPFTSDGKIVAVNIIGRGVDIPGGHIDENESAVEALRRESYEEAQITIGNPILIDVWKLSSTNEELGLSEKPYILLYSAHVESMQDFMANNEVSERLIMEPDDFVATYFGDKQQARIMIDKAMAI